MRDAGWVGWWAGEGELTKDQMTLRIRKGVVVDDGGGGGGPSSTHTHTHTHFHIDLAIFTFYLHRFNSLMIDLPVRSM